MDVQAEYARERVGAVSRVLPVEGVPELVVEYLPPWYGERVERLRDELWEVVQRLQRLPWTKHCVFQKFSPSGVTEEFLVKHVATKYGNVMDEIAFRAWGPWNEWPRLMVYQSGDHTVAGLIEREPGVMHVRRADVDDQPAYGYEDLEKFLKHTFTGWRAKRARRYDSRERLPFGTVTLHAKDTSVYAALIRSLFDDHGIRFQLAHSYYQVCLAEPELVRALRLFPTLVDDYGPPRRNPPRKRARPASFDP
jgi:hypothetical protein